MCSVLRKGAFVLVLMGALLLSKGCSISVEGLGDLWDYITPITIIDCGHDDDCD